MRRLALALSLLLPPALGCGDGDDPDACATPAPTLPEGAKLVSLDADQRGQLCDSSACAFGGYGAKQTCRNGQALTVAKSRSDCLASFPSNPGCEATVAQYRRCMEALRASPCTATLLGSDACDDVTDFACLTFRPSALTTTALELRLDER